MNSIEDLTLKEAAHLLGKRASQTRRLILTGQLPGTKIGGCWRVRHKDVVTALRQGFPRQLPQQHDRTYRHLFSHPRMIEDLVRGFFDEPWVSHLDFSSLEKVSEGFVSDRLDVRWADVVWTVKWREWELPICFVIEFQSTVEPYMGARWLSILGAFFSDQVRNRKRKKEDQDNSPGESSPLPNLMAPPEVFPYQGKAPPYPLLPLVIPIVVYNGKARWRSPTELREQIACPPGMPLPISLRYLLLDIGRVPEDQLEELGRNAVAVLVRLERCETLPELKASLKSLEKWLPGKLLRSLTLWLRTVLRRMGVSGSEADKMLEEVTDFGEKITMLGENLRKWHLKEKEQSRAEGMADGQTEGMAEGMARGQTKVVLRQAKGKFGTVDERTRRQIETADEETLLRIADRILTAQRPSDLF